MSDGLGGLAARIRDANQPDHEVTVGTGILVSERIVVTCAHVVASSIGFDPFSATPPQEAVPLDFPLSSVNSANGPCYAKVIQWKPRAIKPITGELEDVAILSLDRTVSTGEYRPLAAWPQDLYPGKRFRSFGFGQSEGLWVNGECSGAISTGWIQGDSDRREVLPGCSGGPVFDNDCKQLIGMLVAREAGEQLAYMIPAKALRDLVHSKSSQHSDSIERILVRTLDRKPQLDEIEFYGAGKCFVFNCIGADNPEYLAHHIQIKPHLETNSPLNGSASELNPIVLPPQCRAGPEHFKAAFKDIEQDDAAFKVVYTAVRMGRNTEAILLGIRDFLDQPDFKNQLIVLVGCFNVSYSLLSQFRSRRMFSRLRKRGIYPLQTLQALTTEDLYPWVDTLPSYLKQKFDCDGLKQDLWKLLKEGERKRYREIQDEVEEKLTSRRKA